MTSRDEDKDATLINLEDISDPDDPSIETLPDGTIIVRDDT
ncbi:hypothetical protein [Devosia elaeis]|nr:hypothetical protein [Devosia elaeis]